MKNQYNIGINKDVDNSGRICIPKEMRTLLRLGKRVEVVVTPDGVLIRNPEYVLVRRSDISK